MLATASFDGTVKLWDFANGTEVKVLSHTAPIYSISISPDGRTLAGSSSDKTIKLWDIFTGQLLGSFQEKSKFIPSIVFSPDGKTLICSVGHPLIDKTRSMISF